MFAAISSSLLSLLWQRQRLYRTLVRVERELAINKKYHEHKKKHQALQMIG